MKAIVKNTGEVIEVNQVCPEQWAEIARDTIGRRVFQRDALILDEPTDWASFRREAAKDFMCALIMTDKTRGSFAQVTCGDNAGTAIMYADELIRQLKGEQK